MRVPLIMKIVIVWIVMTVVAVAGMRLTVDIGKVPWSSFDLVIFCLRLNFCYIAVFLAVPFAVRYLVVRRPLSGMTGALGVFLLSGLLANYIWWVNTEEMFYISWFMTALLFYLNAEVVFREKKQKVVTEEVSHV